MCSLVSPWIIWSKTFCLLLRKTEPVTTHILRNRLDIKSMSLESSMQHIPIPLTEILRPRGKDRLYTNSLNGSHLLIHTFLGKPLPYQL